MSRLIVNKPEVFFFFLFSPPLRIHCPFVLTEYTKKKKKKKKQSQRGLNIHGK